MSGDSGSVRRGPADQGDEKRRLEEFKAFVKLTAEDVSLVQRFSTMLEPRMPSIFDDLYEEMASFGPLRRFIGSPQEMAAIKRAEMDHWLLLFSKPMDSEYIDRARAVGAVHARIGLDERWYMGAYTKALNHFSDLILTELKFRPADARRMLAAVQKVVMIDMELALSAYGAGMTDGAVDGRVLADNIDNIRQLAKLTEVVNDAMILLADLLRQSRGTESAGQTIASAAEELVASVAEIARSSADSARDAQEIEGTVAAGRQGAERAVDRMGEIARVVESTASQINQLHQASEKIGEILVSIDAIAKQTNLLALNATIEAARAGEAGKGFAVVAGEVKSLSQQTARATEDIRLRIDGLRTEMDAIVKAMGASSQAVADGNEAIAATGEDMALAASRVAGVSGRMTEMSGILGQQTTATQEISAGITHIADMTHDSNHLVEEIARAIGASNKMVAEQVNHWMRSDSALFMLETAKVDHILFRKNIIDTVMGAQSLAPSDVPDHHGCRFGKWFDAQNNPAIVNHPLWASIKDPHQRVHAFAKQALAAHHRGDEEEAYQALRALHDESKVIIKALEALSRDMEQEKQG